jgi:hypothetical protein
VASLACEHDAANGKGCTGPYGGFLVQGLILTHTYASPPPEIFCFVPVKWIVTLSYTPADDGITLAVVGRDAVPGTDGSAVIEFIDVCWTRFTIQVAGTEVALLAEYTVTVEQGNAFT